MDFPDRCLHILFSIKWSNRQGDWMSEYKQTHAKLNFQYPFCSDDVNHNCLNLEWNIPRFTDYNSGITQINQII
jgi:hypothetical protein